MNAFDKQELLNTIVKQYKISNIHGDLAIARLKREVFTPSETIGRIASYEWPSFLLTIKAYVKQSKQD